MNPYKLEITPINPNADGKYFNDWVYKNHNADSVVYLDEKVIVGFAFEPSQVTKDAISSQYQSLTVTDLMYANLIKSKYAKYCQDGCAYFDDIRAQLVLQYQAGIKTDVEVYQIESKLEMVIAKLLRGDWMTALHELNNVTVSGALDQDLYDQIHDYISDYIASNYG